MTQLKFFKNTKNVNSSGYSLEAHKWQQTDSEVHSLLVDCTVMETKKRKLLTKLSFPLILFFPKIYYDKIVTLFEWILPQIMARGYDPGGRPLNLM